MHKQQKFSAAIAAVMHHIHEEEAVLMQAAMGGRTQPPVSAPAARFSPWSMNGRQAQMQMRHLMQMRTFQRGFRI